MTAQRREAGLLSRPWQAAVAGCLAAMAAVAMSGWAGLLNLSLTTLGITVFAIGAGFGAEALWRRGRELRARIAAEEHRVGKARVAQEQELFAWQEDHEGQFHAWQARQQAFAGQPHWYPVALPDGIDRVDVAGGTLAGWSALLTVVAASRLVVGAVVTVVDLSEGAVAHDLVALAEEMGVKPLVWVLPGDLPRLDLGVGMPAGPLADVLAASACADPAGAAGLGASDLARDYALVERVLGVVGEGAGIAHVTAGLRALGQVGDPRADIATGLLTAVELERITGMYGRAATDRVVIERAWALEARLRILEQLGTDPVALPDSGLRVIALDRGGTAFGNAMLGTYVTVALTHLLRHAPRGRPWQHTLCLAGAEKLGGEVLDRLCAACESTGTGLVLTYRSIPPAVKERLGRGNAAVAFMRLGNAEDARIASEQIGMEHRFVLSQLTDTVGAAVTDTGGWSYTSTVGTADSTSVTGTTSLTEGSSRGHGYSRSDIAPFAHRTGSGSRDSSQSTGTSTAESITEGINASTSWGLSTSTAIGTNSSLAQSIQRSREFLVEPHELQQLPPSAVIVSYPAPAGRRVVLADANPGILTLPTVSTQSLGEATKTHERAGPARTGTARPRTAAGAGRVTQDLGPGRDPARAPVSWRDDENKPPPNLGPPPEPLDWRRHRRR